MNALELKQKLKESDNHKTLLKIFGLSILVSLIIFPINYLFNPNIDPVVTEHPILLAFGFVAFVMMFAVFIVGGLVSIMLLLDSYLLVSPRVLDSYGRFNTHSVLRDSEITNRMANGIHQTLKRLRLDDFTLQIDEAKKGIRNEIKETNDRIDNHEIEIEELKADVKELKVENRRKDKKINWQNQKIFKIEWENKRLRRENNELKKKEIKKTQIIDDKAHTKINTENNDIKKFKDIDE